MKRFSLTVMVVLFFGLLTFAQGRPRKQRMRMVTPVERAERMTQRMTKKLGLDKEQQLKVNEINLDFCKEMQDFQHKKRVLTRICCPKDTACLSVKARKSLAKVNRSEMKELNKFAGTVRAARINRLKEVLTTSQFEQFEQNRKDCNSCCFMFGNLPAKPNPVN